MSVRADQAFAIAVVILLAAAPAIAQTANPPAGTQLPPMSAPPMDVPTHIPQPPRDPGTATAAPQTLPPPGLNKAPPQPPAARAPTAATARAAPRSRRPRIAAARRRITSRSTGAAKWHTRASAACRTAAGGSHPENRNSAPQPSNGHTTPRGKLIASRCDAGFSAQRVRPSDHGRGDHAHYRRGADADRRPDHRHRSAQGRGAGADGTAIELRLCRTSDAGAAAAGGAAVECAANALGSQPGCARRRRSRKRDNAICADWRVHR